MSYITPDTAAEQLGVTAKTVREWLKSKTLIGVKLGGSWKIHKKDLQRFVDGQRLQALISKARDTHAQYEWIESQCESCGDLTPIPDFGPKNKNNWVCSVECKVNYDAQWASFVGYNTEEFAVSQGRVIPHF